MLLGSSVEVSMVANAVDAGTKHGLCVRNVQEMFANKIQEIGTLGQLLNPSPLSGQI